MPRKPAPILARRRLRLALSLALAGMAPLAAGGCGQTGPLYLPPSAGPLVAPAAPPPNSASPTLVAPGQSTVTQPLGEGTDPVPRRR